MAFNYFPGQLSGKISGPKFQFGITPLSSERQLFSLFELPPQNPQVLISSISLPMSPFDFKSKSFKRNEISSNAKVPNSRGFRKSLTRYSPLPQYYLFLKTRRSNSAPVVQSRWTGSNLKNSNEHSSFSTFASPVRKQGFGSIAKRSQGFSQYCPVRSSPALIDGELISPKDFFVKTGE